MPLQPSKDLAARLTMRDSYAARFPVNMLTAAMITAMISSTWIREPAM
jgi:hypothetical protein